MNEFSSFRLFDNCIGRKRSVGDDVLADVGKPASKRDNGVLCIQEPPDWFSCEVGLVNGALVKT